jgi:transposase
MQTLTDNQWERISAFLLHHTRVYKATHPDSRRFLDGVLWLFRTGAQWRALPKDFGNWKSVHSRFSDWSKKGIFSQLLQHLSKSEADFEWLSLDSTVIRAHMCATPAREHQAKEGLGRSRGGFSTKIHVKVDALGMPLKLAITAGQRNDKVGWPLLREECDAQASHLLADRGYDSNAIRKELEEIGVEAVIPSTRSRKEPIPYDQHIYAHRHVVECFIGKIKWFRRVFTRFDVRMDSYLAFVSFASCMVWMR